LFIKETELGDAGRFECEVDGFDVGGQGFANVDIKDGPVVFTSYSSPI
jgi:hypothetical protein